MLSGKLSSSFPVNEHLEINPKYNLNLILDFAAHHSQQSRADIIVYSVLFGAYDSPPKVVHEDGVEFFIFTDQPELVKSPWHAITVDSSIFGGQRTGRYLKCLAHLLFPNAQKCLYFDASFKIRKPIRNLISDYSSASFALFKHPNHDDIRSEGNACIRQGKDSKPLIDAQITKYRKDGLPVPSLCYATGALIRDLSSPAVAELNEAWCAEIVSGSLRDQIGLPFVFWRHNFAPSVLQGNVFYNKYLVPMPHSNSSFRKKFSRRLALYLYTFGLLRKGI